MSKFISLSIVLVLGLLSFQSDAFAAPQRITSCPYTVTKPGLHVLTRNFNCVGDGITITQHYATIDLQGFTLRGDGTGAGVTDGGVDYEGIVVRNGTLTSFDSGVVLGSSEDASVEDMRIIENLGVAGNGILVAEGGRVVGSSVVGNGNVGISATNTFNAVIVDNTVRDNGGIGIDGGLGCIIKDNMVSFNGSEGIHSISRCTINGNFVQNNTGDGIDSGIDTVLSNNNVTNNGGSGIAGSCPSIVVENTVANNTGIELLFGGDPALCESALNIPTL